MKAAIIKLFCPCCGVTFFYGEQKSETMHHKEFGIVCSKVCHKLAELKYAQMILGKDSL